MSRYPIIAHKITYEGSPCSLVLLHLEFIDRLFIPYVLGVAPVLHLALRY